MANKITMIPVGKITEHPNNPRKNLGDLAELVESIRIHGIMQNLTVVKREEAIEGLLAEYRETPSQIYTNTLDELKNHTQEYVVLLGHRRLAAAGEADLDEVPCIIKSGLTLNEQISLMLLENMQRNNLTFVEEADSFQMMLDLGDTVSTVAEKTGFSESTVRRRAELAKLDRKHLQTIIDKAEEGGYQITLTDLDMLSKVDSEKDRNVILKESNTGPEIKRRVENYIRDKEREEHVRKTREAIEKITGKKPGKEPKNYMKWSHEWQTLIEIETGKDPEKVIKSKKYAEIAKNLPDDFFVTDSYGDAIIAAKRGKTKVKLTPQEKEQKEKDRRLKELRKLRKTMLTEWEEWLFGIIDSTTHSDKKNLSIIKEAINLAERAHIWLSTSQLTGHFGGKDPYEMSDEERSEANEARENAQACAKMLIHICHGMKEKETWDWRGVYAGDANAQDHANNLSTLFGLMCDYGYEETTDEYVEFIGGVHELFTKGEK